MNFNESWKDETKNALRDHLSRQPVTAQTVLVVVKTPEYIAESVEFDIGDS